MSNAAAVDQAKMEAFTHRVLEDTSAMTVTIMAYLGDRLGLFKDLATNGSATSTQLAKRAGINERYAREWLSAMACAGYLEYDPEGSCFTLPPEHVPVLAQEYGPFFFGGVHQALIGDLAVLDQIEQAFRDGTGVPQSAYPDTVWCGVERFTGSWFENSLVQEWIPAVPEVQAKLQNGTTPRRPGSRGFYDNFKSTFLIRGMSYSYRNGDPAAAALSRGPGRDAAFRAGSGGLRRHTACAQHADQGAGR